MGSAGLAPPASAGMNAAMLDAPYGSAGKASRVLDLEWDGDPLR